MSMEEKLGVFEYIACNLTIRKTHETIKFKMRL